MLKAAPLDEIKGHLQPLLSFATALGENKTLVANTMIRKFRTKIISRVAIRMLPPNPSAGRRKGRLDFTIVKTCSFIFNRQRKH